MKQPASVLHHCLQEWLKSEKNERKFLTYFRINMTKKIFVNFLTPTEKMCQIILSIFTCKSNEKVKNMVFFNDKSKFIVKLFVKMIFIHLKDFFQIIIKIVWTNGKITWQDYVARLCGKNYVAKLRDIDLKNELCMCMLYFDHVTRGSFFTLFKKGHKIRKAVVFCVCHCCPVGCPAGCR